jgi:hypothetical protein
MESILETKAATILQFFAGLRGTLSVTFEEGTWSAWLYDLLNSHVDKLVVCNPRKNAPLKDGNKSESLLDERPAQYAFHRSRGCSFLSVMMGTITTNSKRAPFYNAITSVIRAASHFKSGLAKIQFLTIECRLELGGTQDHSQGGGRMRYELSGCPHAALTYGGVSW